MRKIVEFPLLLLSALSCRNCVRAINLNMNSLENLSRLRISTASCAIILQFRRWRTTYVDVKEKSSPLFRKASLSVKTNI